MEELIELEDPIELISKNYKPSIWHSPKIVNDKKLSLFDFIREELEPESVGVYIWYSSRRGGESIGHIAIGFGEHYASFWPIKPLPEDSFLLEKLERKSTLDEFEGHWESRIGDGNCEKRPPEYVAYLSSLDIQKMQEKFDEIKAIVPKWHLLASSPLKKERTLNCIAVVIELLRAGGIEELAKEKINRDIDDLKNCRRKCAITIVFLAFFSYFVSAVALILFLLSIGDASVREATDKIPRPLIYASIPFLLFFGSLVCCQKFCSKKIRRSPLLFGIIRFRTWGLSKTWV